MELHLKQGQTLLGVLSHYASDFPWFKCKFEAAPDFTEVKQLFEQELELLEADKLDQWEIAYERINALGLKLIDIRTHEEIDEFLKELKPGFGTNDRSIVMKVLASSALTWVITIAFAAGFVVSVSVAQTPSGESSDRIMRERIATIFQSFARNS